MVGRSPIPASIVRNTFEILDAAYEVHSEIGPGCLERVYHRALEHVLEERGHHVASEVALPVAFRGRVLADVGYRLDMVVDESVAIEIKSVDALVPRHRAQLLTYLKMSGLTVGLLLNFAEVHLREGYDRIVHPSYEFLPPSRLEPSRRHG